MSGHDQPGTGGHGRPVSRHERRHERPRQVTRPQTAPPRWRIIGALVVALALIGGGGYYTFAPKHSGAVAHKDRGPQPGAAIDGLHCGPMEGRAEHIHAHVALFWNGKPVTIPALVGIPYNQNVAGNYCYYSLHTHATTNVVHIEAPSTGTYTLGQFVDIWHYTSIWDGQSLIAQAPIIDASFADALRAAKPGDVHVYVGAKLVQTPYRDVTFADHKNVTVELGTPLKPPVATFDWQHWNGS
jgi:hypothetical protein